MPIFKYKQEGPQPARPAACKARSLQGLTPVSDSVPGSSHDLTLKRGDKGYQGLQNDNPQRRMEVPCHKPRGQALMEE
jgi:hypothetical protein